MPAHRRGVYPAGAVRAGHRPDRSRCQPHAPRTPPHPVGEDSVLPAYHPLSCTSVIERERCVWVMSGYLSQRLIKSDGWMDRWMDGWRGHRERPDRSLLSKPGSAPEVAITINSNSIHPSCSGQIPRSYPQHLSFSHTPPFNLSASLAGSKIPKHPNRNIYLSHYNSIVQHSTFLTCVCVTASTSASPFSDYPQHTSKNDPLKI